MVQIVNDPNYGKSGLLTGLDSALQGLISHKVGEIQQKKKSQTLGNAFTDIPKEALDFLSGLPPKEQMEALQGLGDQARAQQEKQSQQPMMGQQGEPSEEDIMKHLPAFLQSEEGKQAFSPEEHAELLKMVSQPQQQAQKSEGLKLSQLGGGKSKSLVDINVGNQKKQESKKQVQDAYDTVKEILDSGYTGYSISGLTPEGRKQRAKFNTLSEVFVSHMIPLINPKGTLPKERFKYILDQAIPTSSDTDATIKGKLEGLRDIFDLEDSNSKKSKDATPEKSSNTIEMKDDNGTIYDIPSNMVDKAKKAGLK